MVDILAPGTDILSPSIDYDSATRPISGTSMAARPRSRPGCLFTSVFGNMEPYQLCRYIQSVPTKNAVAGVPQNTLNDLVYNDNPNGYNSTLYSQSKSRENLDKL
jgi:hypothetical protein